MAYLRFLRAHCPHCHQHRADWFDENGKELKDPAYQVIPTLCPACEMLDDANEEERAKKRHGYHLMFQLTPDLRPDPDAASSGG